MRDIETGVKRAALRSLHAMVRPQNLLAIRHLDRVERLLAGMRTGERGVPRGMPVLGQDYMRESGSQLVDHRDDRITIGNRERSAEAEIVLDVDDQKDLTIVPCHCLPRSRGMISRAMIST